MFKISVGMGLIRDVVVLLIGIVIGIGIVSKTPSPSLVQQNVNDGQVNVLGLDELDVTTTTDGVALLLPNMSTTTDGVALLPPDIIMEDISLSQMKMLLSESLVQTNMHRTDIEDVLRFHTWIRHIQNPSDCSKVQQHHFRGWGSGLGSHLQIIGNSFLRALLNRHVFILDYHKIDYVDPSRCSDQNYKCLFLPTTSCEAKKFDLPIGAKIMEQGPHRCTTFDPITFTEEAQLSQVYSTDWYFREALRYLTRPNIELRQFIEEVKNEIGLSNVGKKGIGLKIRAGEDKEQEVHNIANVKCLNINAGKGMDWVNEIKRHCERVHCEYVFLSADKDTELLEEELQNLPFDIKVMDSKYFVQQDLSHGTSAASMIKNNIQKRHEGSDESVDFDEAMSLMAMMQIMAETRDVVGSFTSSLTRRIYDLLGMIEDNPASLFTEIDGLSYFNCWRDLGEWGLHKKDEDGNLVYDCLSSPPPLQRQVATDYSLNYPEQCQIPMPPTNMKCGSVGYWYCSKSNVAYLPNPKVCSSTVRSILRRKFDGTCAEMPPGTLHMIPKDAYVFTVARNPISRVFAAYREFDSHLLIHPYPEGLKSNFIHMDRNNEPQRFRTFLDDLFTGRTGLNDGYTGWPAHVYPQYLVMCGAPHVNFTLRQESFNEGWQDMMEDMGPVHNILLKSADLNAKNVGSNLHDRKVFEDVLGFDIMKTMPAFETAHTRLPTVMTDSDYELICKYFKEDFSCLGYSCDYNSTALAEKAYDKLNKMEQARWLPESNKLPSQLLFERKLDIADRRLVYANKKREAAERKTAHVLKKQEIADRRLVYANKKREAAERKTDHVLKKQEIADRRLVYANKKREAAEHKTDHVLKGHQLRKLGKSDKEAPWGKKKRKKSKNKKQKKIKKKRKTPWKSKRRKQIQIEIRSGLQVATSSGDPSLGGLSQDAVIVLEITIKDLLEAASLFDVVGVTVTDISVAGSGILDITYKAVLNVTPGTTEQDAQQLVEAQLKEDIGDGDFSTKLAASRTIIINDNCGSAVTCDELFGAVVSVSTATPTISPTSFPSSLSPSFSV